MIIDLKKYTSIKIGPITNVEIFTEQSFDNRHFIIGLGSNIIIDDNHPKLAMIDSKYDFIDYTKDTLTVGSRVKNSTLVKFAMKHDLAGLEFIQKIPGNIGGTIKMNAGLKEFEIIPTIKKVKIGNKILTPKSFSHSYRYTDISEPIFFTEFKVKRGFNETLLKRFEAMRKNQPKGNSAGSCFKNPSNDYAGRLIEEIGLKGIVKNNIGFNAIHANFLTNYGDATYRDALYIINEAKNRVKDKFNINLELENILVTNDNTTK